MADFLPIHLERMDIEGGSKKSMRPNDSGNWTGGKTGVGQLIGSKWGITAPLLSKHLGRTATMKDMDDLTFEDSCIISKPTFWDKMRGDEIKDQGNAKIIYNLVYNAGQGVGISVTEESLGITLIDGKMDDLTLQKLNNEKEII